MAFKQYVREEVAAGLDETYRFETWSANTTGRDYFEVHLSVIEERETSVPTLRRALAGAGLRILESGCGTGRWMAFFERLGHRPIGIDDSAAPLRTAKSHDPGMLLVRADARSAPFRAAAFDAVFSSYVAEHFEEGLTPVLGEIRRLLKPGGRLLIVVPYDNLFRRLVTHRVLDAFYLWSRWHGERLAFTEYRYSRREVERALGSAGFRVEHVEPDDFRLPWAKGLSVDLGPLVAPPGAAAGSWELNSFGRLLARFLAALSPWFTAAGVLCVARSTGPKASSPQP